LGPLATESPCIRKQCHETHVAYTSTLNGVMSQLHAPVALPPNAKTTDKRQIGGWLAQESIWTI